MTRKSSRALFVTLGPDHKLKKKYIDLDIDLDLLDEQRCWLRCIQLPGDAGGGTPAGNPESSRYNLRFGGYHRLGTVW